MKSYTDYPLRNTFQVEDYLKNKGFKVSAVCELGQDALEEIEKNVKKISKNGVTVHAFFVDGIVLCACQVNDQTKAVRHIPDAHLPAIQKLF
jgi:hypothetical protein